MKKIIKVCLFILVILIGIGIQSVYAEDDSTYYDGFIPREQYDQKYGNKILIFGKETSEGLILYDHILSGTHTIKIGDSLQFSAFLVDIDDLTNAYTTLQLHPIKKIDFDDLEITQITHPNIASIENGKITGIAEGYFSFSCIYEEDGIKYPGIYSLIDIGDGFDISKSLDVRIAPYYDDYMDDYNSYSHFEDKYYSYVTINNTISTLNSEKNSDEIYIRCWNAYAHNVDWNPAPELYSFEWSIDDPSIVSIENYSENDENSSGRYDKWISDKKIIAKKNGTTKVRCKISTLLENGETQTIEKVVDVTVQGLENEETSSSENTTNETQKTDTKIELKETEDKTVADKPLAQAGKNHSIIILIIATILFSIYGFKKYRKL